MGGSALVPGASFSSKCLMPRNPKYHFGDQAFTSKEAVRRFASEMRARYGVGVTISKPADIAFLQDLIQGHVERVSKIGVGVKRYFVNYAPDHPGDCFWIERVDGSDTDFGVLACLQDIGRVNRLALRMAIRGDLDKFKIEALASCGETFASGFSGREFPVAEAVADHVTTFEEIIVQFFTSRGVDIETAMLTRSVDRRSDPAWIDPLLLEEFLAEHRRYPLRLVHWRENLSEIKKTAATRGGV